MIPIAATDASGWATGAIQDLKLLGSQDALTAISGLPDGIVTIAYSGPAGEGLLPWGTEAWKCLEGSVGELVAGSGQLLLRGHHEHVLADAPACLGWLDRCQESGHGCGIALSPASMLAPAMLETMEDHLVRMFEYLGPRCQAVIIEDLHLSDGGAIRGVTVGKGILKGSLVGQLLDTHVPDSVPVVVQAVDLKEAQKWLWPD